MTAPWRRDFDTARDPYAARNALGITSTGGGGSFQPLDATLTALAAYNTNGLLTQTAADTFAGRTLAAPAAGFTITNPAGTAGNPTFVLANDLAALEALAGTNTIYYRSGTDAWTAVTIGANLTFTGGTLAATVPSAPATPTRQVFTSGSGTYTKPGSVRWIEVEMIGGGGGGSAGSGGTGGGAGGNTTFGSAFLLCNGGVGGAIGGVGGGGGAASGGDINIAGAAGAWDGSVGNGTTYGSGSTGGGSYFAGGGAGKYNLPGVAAPANSGAGGGGGSNNGPTVATGGEGGGAGGYLRKLITSPSATYAYAVGAAGAAGTAGGIGYAGGSGGSGIIIVTEYY